MSGKSELISRVLSVAEETGLTGISPVELSDSANLILHLAPHPVVARIATVLSRQDAAHACRILERELRAARHLHANGVPVLLPSDHADAGPYVADGTWMAFWQYIPRTQLPPLSPGEAVALVNGLSTAMKDFSDVETIPKLGVWERAYQSARRLCKQSDPRIQALLGIFRKVDDQMRAPSNVLIPCHGDAHKGNLMPGPEGWIWSDFEDMSLMPAHWDLASFICNTALFGGIKEPAFRSVWGKFDNSSDLKAFGFAMIARVLMSTLGNLDLALAGHGDLPFATKQLELAEDFIGQIELLVERGIQG